MAGYNAITAALSNPGGVNAAAASAPALAGTSFLSPQTTSAMSSQAGALGGISNQQAMQIIDNYNP